MSENLSYRTSGARGVSDEKKEIVKNLSLSKTAQEFAVMQVDLEIPMVISILRNWMYIEGK
jgi:hypothetical protein